MRRSLQEHKSELRNSALVLSVPLRRDFARKPAYWVEIYRTTQAGTNADRYYVARQWGFGRSGTKELVQDANVSKPVFGLNKAIEATKKALDAKIEAGWLLCKADKDTNPPDTYPTMAERSALAAYIADWAEHFDKTLEEMNVEKADLPRSVKFKDAQRKRRAKAEW